jgi:hypothetical protein
MTTINSGPKYLNFEKIGPFLKLEKDRLTIQYTGPGNQSQDVGVSCTTGAHYLLVNA